MRSLGLTIAVLIGSLVCSSPQSAADEANAKSAAGEEYVYKESAGKPRRMEIYFPPGHDPSRDRVPGVLLFHGGGWTGGSLGQFRFACEYFASRGLVAATAEYRMHRKADVAKLPSGESKKRVCITDARSAIRWFKRNADELGIDPERIVTGGGSAGGHTSVLATLQDGLDDPADRSPTHDLGESDSIPQDQDQTVPETSVVAYLLFNPAFTSDDAADPEVDVSEHLTAGMPPAIVFFGTEDQAWKPGWDAASKRLRELGNTGVREWIAAGEGHGFFNRPPWREWTLIEADRFLTRLGLLEGEPTLTPPETDAKLVRELTVTLRSQHETAPESGRFRQVMTAENWRPEETAVIVCDVWDSHTCRNAVRRLTEFAPRLDALLDVTREMGVTIVHAPSGCMDAYEGHPARRRAMTTPIVAELPEEITRWCYQIPAEERGVYPIDQTDGGNDDTPEERTAWVAKLKAMGRDPRRPWQRQSDMITIDPDRDFITDRGDEVWSLLEARGIKNVMLTGVHVNMCVLGRPFGLRQMVRNGKNAVLVRDLTDAMYNPQSWPYVSHFTGNDLIVEHIERYVCPTITSDQILGGETFRFEHDTRPHVVIRIAEDDETESAWRRFAVEGLGKSFRVTVQPATEKAIAGNADSGNAGGGNAASDLPRGADVVIASWTDKGNGRRVEVRTTDSSGSGRAFSTTLAADHELTRDAFRQTLAEAVYRASETPIPEGFRVTDAPAPPRD